MQIVGLISSVSCSVAWYNDENNQMYVRFKVSSVDVENSHISLCYAM